MYNERDCTDPRAHSANLQLQLLRSAVQPRQDLRLANLQAAGLATSLRWPTCRAELLEKGPLHGLEKNVEVKRRAHDRKTPESARPET